MNKPQTTITAPEGQPYLLLTREFNAPRELVFKAHVDPALYAQWLGPRNRKLTLEIFEPRDGGRYLMSTPLDDGQKINFFGVYHEVTAPERIINSWEFDGLPERGHVEFTTTTFEDLPGGRSRLTSRSVYFSLDDRDAAMASGMETGVNEGYEQLDELLETMGERA
jgi:uncharacterized protein YndB with AHSA1/START domain